MRSFALISMVFLTALTFSWAKTQENCLVCHGGIEKISERPVMGGLTCTQCHRGDALAHDKAAAHKGMYANPSDLRVAHQSCGICHPKDLENAKKSLHATSAGKISGARYAWGAQGREGIYATRAVENPGATKGAKVLKPLPAYDPNQPAGPENTPVDDYLRNQCLRCHLWNSGGQQEGDYRASGCAACHVGYSDSGTYEGKDPMISKEQKGRPRFHRISSQITTNQCIHCHNRGGRTGPSYTGLMESDGYGTPYTASGGKQGKLHGKQYNHLKADLHYEKGLVCIDCHTKQEMHGDGSIPTKREQALEVRCADCHGTIEKPSNLKTSAGNPHPRLSMQSGQVVLTEKLTGKLHKVPQIATLASGSAGYKAMVSIPSHTRKMECYACHSGWAPQCYGCHVKQDIGKKGGDWLNTKPSEDPSQGGNKPSIQPTAKDWDESRSYLRWESPVLGINTKGKVSPFIPGGQVIFTQVDGQKGLLNNHVFTTKDGTSGIGMNPIQPHTTTRRARACAECHSSSKALGLGSGQYDSRKNGLPIDFELERIVDEDGVQLQQTAHEGARPFNKAELSKIKRKGN